MPILKLFGGKMRSLKNVLLYCCAIIALVVFIIALNSQFAMFVSTHNTDSSLAALARRQTPTNTTPASKKGRSTRTPAPKRTRVLPSATPSKINVASLHVIKKQQADQLLRCDLRVAVSPNRKQFVCGNVHGGRGVWLGNFKKGLTQKLAEKPGYVQWYPDGMKIAYSVGVPSGHPTTLFEINLATGERTIIGQTVNASHFQVDSAGRVLFFTQKGATIWNSVDRQTSLVRNSNSPLGQTANGEFGSDPAASDSSFLVSPNGEYMAIQSVWYEKGTLTLTELSSGATFTVTDQMGNSAQPMAWTPDSSQLLYSTKSDNPVGSALWLVNANGSNLHQVWQTDQCVSIEYVTLMVDGQTPLFVCTEGGNSFEVYWHYMALDPSASITKELFTNGEGLDLINDGFDLLIFRSVQDVGNWIVEISQ